MEIRYSDEDIYRELLRSKTDLPDGPENDSEDTPQAKKSESEKAMGQFLGSKLLPRR